ncbi:cilia- and flagella-associated protein 300-like [Thrips palmi]|uniref:Cilia- and flagella-associated protein 300 n=1 Tax=Thrips palmi TaxID=161013 RepID=A0A6P8YH19_THRPL|nr:cilia- and flagella-associated protein 300-like [Thrips palmi]
MTATAATPATAAPFHFVCLDTKTDCVLSEPSIDGLLKKWSMKGYLRAQRYSFNEAFQVYQKEDLARAFFGDPHVVSTLRSFPAGKARAAHEVAVQRVPCSLTSTALFRRLAKVGVVRGEDLITPCAETQVGDIVINDRLRRILVDEEDEDWDVFTAGERAEFLVQLLRLLVVGGKWCQYEDTLTPYIDTARAIYKHLVSVEKDPDGIVVVRSVVLKVVAKDEDGEPILPLNPEHPQDVAFLCIDPVRRIVNVLSHHYGEDLVE